MLSRFGFDVQVLSKEERRGLKVTKLHRVLKKSHVREDLDNIAREQAAELDVLHLLTMAGQVDDLTDKELEGVKILSRRISVRVSKLLEVGKNSVASAVRTPNTKECGYDEAFMFLAAARAIVENGR